MEVFVFGLTALIALNNKQERIVAEPAEFQSFDLPTLGRLHDARENSAAGRLIGSDCMWSGPCPDGRAYVLQVRAALGATGPKTGQQKFWRIYYRA